MQHPNDAPLQHGDPRTCWVSSMQRTRYRVSGLRFLGRDAKGKDLWRRENAIVDLGG